jgi:hypothetical protein
MATWAEFSAASPDLAAAGRRLIYRVETGQALLATVRGEEPPRIHPIWVAIVGERLYAFILRSAKRTDLERDGRYALHTQIDPAAPSEFSIRGRARLVHATDERADVARQWYFEADDAYELFEFDVEAAVLGVRDNEDEWPPRYTSWKAP